MTVTLGFLMGHMGDSQLSYELLRAADAALRRTDGVDVLAFYQNATKPWTTPCFSLLNISEAFGFGGAAIATDLDTAAKLLHFPGPRARYFYVWDLEWVGTARGRPYEEFAAVYCNPDLKLVARSTSHAGVLARVWNRPVRAVVERFNLEDFMRMVQHDCREGP